MKLIESVKVKYFRSFYNQTVKNTSDLNIVFGKNDSGKSNLLRALNLFFNFETVSGHNFDFEKDYSKTRDSESARNTDVVISVKFKTPKSYLKSLGKNFTLTRSWNKDLGGRLYKREKIYGVDEKNRKYAWRCVGNMQYHYIPAIKDRGIFSSLLEEMYRTISTDQSFTDSLSRFSEELSTQTQSLSQGLLENINVRSNLAPPVDLTNMFRSLDFDTGEKDVSPLSLILQRGDGIQVRHIPEILSFIAGLEGSKPWHIWGFEEPENSLDLASAIREAELFKGHATSNNKQIFMTSHSPAFYNLMGDEVSRYFIHKTQDSQFDSEIEKISNEIPSELMNDIPYLDSMSISLKRAEAEILDLQREREYLAEKIRDSDQPIVLVEGESDKTILKKAWSVITGEEQMPFEIYSLRGTKGFQSLGKDERAGLASAILPDRLVFCLLDNDEDGRNVAPNKRVLKTPGKWTKENNVFWCLLSHSEEHQLWINVVGLNGPVPCTIESCFSSAVRIKAVQENCYGFEEGYYQELQRSEKNDFLALQKFNQHISVLRGAVRFNPQQNYKDLYHEIFDSKALDDAIENEQILADQLDAFSVWFKARKSVV